MSSFDSHVLWPAAVVVTAIVAPAQVTVAATYLSVEAAQRALFPAAQSFDELTLAPSAAQLAAIAAAAGVQAQHGELRVWAARSGNVVLGHVFVDNVIGREDFITYAVGIDAHGALLPVEILDYRESHGGEIRNKRWLAQFEGRAAESDLAFRTDIKNIAGATLSSEHVTAGVRWLLALWQTAVQPAAAGD
jgi:Na+-translocating ferredoxin:NAD+ oxidoreductase RnfG subunit